VNKQDDAFTIRAAEAGDGEGILECLALAFAPYQQAYTPDAFLDTVLTPKTVLERMAQMSIFVATDESGKVVGTIACKVMEHGRGHLRGMAVRPEFQGSGLSSRLLNTAQEELRNSGCKRITLNTTEPLKRATRLSKVRVPTHGQNREFLRHGFV
jgi:predicted N-acetyltransferase YhbS